MRAIITVAIIASLFAARPVWATSDSEFLVVTGKITRGETVEGTKVYKFSRAEFDKLRQVTIRTGTSWTPGQSEFRGPLMRDVLAAVGAAGTSVEAVAVDDYIYKIPVSDFTRYDVILASTMDGHPLLPDKYGPLWIIYPRDQFPGELKNAVADAKSVWQITRLQVK
jgi:hypothetical protein